MQSCPTRSGSWSTCPAQLVSTRPLAKVIPKVVFGQDAVQFLIWLWQFQRRICMPRDAEQKACLQKVGVDQAVGFEAPLATHTKETSMQALAHQVEELQAALHAKEMNSFTAPNIYRTIVCT